MPFLDFEDDAFAAVESAAASDLAQALTIADATLQLSEGVRPTAYHSYMGHTSITTTIDRYGHLLPGNETEAAGLLEQWLEANTGSAQYS